MMFNMAHSSSHAVYALTHERPIGVDLELVRSLPNLEHIFSQFLAPTEFQALCGLSNDRRLEAFFTLWTLKEAFLKALGLGLSFPPRKLAISMGSGANEDPHLVRIEIERERPDLWTLKSMRPFDNYVASIAIRSVDLMI